jgi:excinuclease ABC subunit A
MDSSTIVIRGAREHNLRNVNLELPRNQLIVFTGVSGSGKSSLAFDTLYAEGQRRYVESLSAYARQFLGQLQKPDVDYLAGLSPSISIQQKSAGKNPRSTVGTITEIHDYLRVLFARVGQGHCPECGRPITAQSREQILNRILALPDGTRFLVLAPVIRGQKGEYKDLFQDLLRRGPAAVFLKLLRSCGTIPSHVPPCFHTPPPRCFHSYVMCRSPAPYSNSARCSAGSLFHGVFRSISSVRASPS